MPSRCASCPEEENPFEVPIFYHVHNLCRHCSARFQSPQMLHNRDRSPNLGRRNMPKNRDLLASALPNTKVMGQVLKWGKVVFKQSKGGDS